uniref:Uncharacterized protein n=1 Tax=Cacopsylla melanoneura TaxID=428564 RepID=A0A8D8V7A8_9HEMI
MKDMIGTIQLIPLFFLDIYVLVLSWAYFTKLMLGDAKLATSGEMKMGNRTTETGCDHAGDAKLATSDRSRGRSVTFVASVPRGASSGERRREGRVVGADNETEDSAERTEAGQLV